MTANHCAPSLQMELQESKTRKHYCWPKKITIQFGEVTYEVLYSANNNALFHCTQSKYVALDHKI